MKTQLILCSLFLPSLLMAQGVSTGGGTLKLPQHALSASLSDLGSVEAGRLDAMGMNPATLAADTHSTSVAFTHAAWIQQISGQRIAVSFPTVLGRFAMSAMTTKVPGIEVREGPGPALGSFSAQTASLQVGWASGVVDGIVAGIAASYLYEKLYVNETSGFSVDAGLLASTPIPELTVALSAVNLGGMTAFRSTSVELPATIRAAASYRMTMGEFILRPAVAIHGGLNHDDFGVTLGGTVMFDDLIGLRASWRSGETARSVALGLTAAYRGLGVEYAVIPFTSGLGTAQVLTFGLNF